MGIIHTTPRKSGTEALLKLLDNLTDEIVLVHGIILMGQFSQNYCNALKLSLYLEETVYEHIGVRNIFIEDVSDTVELRFGDKMETQMSLEVLRQTRDWNLAFPPTHRAVYPIAKLDDAAVQMRDYLLFGRLPGTDVDEALQKLIKNTVPDKGYVSFDILASLTDYGSW